MVLDPSLQEETIQQGDMTVVMNVHREICTLTKAGGTPLEPGQILRCAQISLIKATELTNLIRTIVVRKEPGWEALKLSKRFLFFQ